MDKAFCQELRARLQFHLLLFLTLFFQYYLCTIQCCSFYGLQLRACGLTPDHTVDSTCTKPEPLPYDLGAQALHLVEVQDPFNCSFI